MASHRTRTAETPRFTSRTTTDDPSLPPVSRGIHSNGGSNTITSPKRSSTTSITSTGGHSGGTGEIVSRLQQPRPSALPRSTSSSSQARLSYIASSRPIPTFAVPTTNIPKLDTSRPFLSSDSYRNQHSQSLSPMDMDDDTVLGIAMPGKPSTYPPANLPPRLIPELQALAASTTRPGNPASSSISSISSPSTQFTASSSPWSASTAATTPVSWSSASPSISQAMNVTNKRSHTVPMPSNIKARTPKLPILKESQTPASSSKVTLPSDSERSARRWRKTNTPDPTPPPRSSSLKSTRSRSNSAATTRIEKQSALEPTIQQFPAPPTTTSVPAIPSEERKEPSANTKKPALTQGHSRLQEAINSAPQQHTERDLHHSTKQQGRIAPSQSHPKQLLEPLPVVQTQHRRFPSLSRRHAQQSSSTEPEVEKQSARSRLAKFSRMALFGRSKTAADTEAKTQKLQSRRGPAAGTGHEGYGRFGRRGRKQSISSSTGATDSETSVASVVRRPVDRRQSRVSSNSQDQSDLDEFASSRLKPVVMIGGSQRGRTNPFLSTPKDAQLSDLSLSSVNSTEIHSAPIRATTPRRERFISEHEEIRPTLATRRSQKLAMSEPFRFPEPIETQDLTATPCLDSKNTTQSSDLATPASAMYRLDPSLLEKQRTKSRKLKWNIFRRKDSVSEPDERPVQRSHAHPDVSVDVAPAPSSRPVPYYAMLESESEVTTTATIGQFLREAAESPEKDNEYISVGFSDDEVMENPYDYRESILLPSAPVRQQQQVPMPIVASTLPGESSVPGNWPLDTEMSEDNAHSRKQPRLAQVGRIPKVVLTRNQPQPGVQVAHVPQMPVLRHVTGPIQPRASHEQLPRLTTRQPPAFRRQNPIESRAQDEIDRSVQLSQNQFGFNEPEFLQYAGVRTSDFTTSSESTGIISIMGPSASDVAYVPSRPVSHLPHEDEVWNEYNDFMDDIMSPSQQTKSTQKPSKFEKASTSGGRLAVSTKGSAKAGGLAIVPAPIPAAGPSRQFLGTPPLSHMPSLQEMVSSEEIRLRRSRIAPALHASYAPSSPFSMRDFIEEYGRPGSGKFSERLSGSSAQAPTPTQAHAQPQREHSRPRQYENAVQLEEIERTRNPTKHSDRSYASLMVSRWLSFGRVLFSPAHQEIEANPERHVLVIDGLGSEDWSMYCAVTYQQERVYVHDLKERRQGRAKAKAAQSTESAPPNHRRSEVSSFNDRFPFPPGFFCAIVVRFPPAMPDSKLKNIVSECRRVLAPGGHLELMVLDLDIVNMGVQTRRAIKDLKIKMTAADRAVSLKPIIDNVQTVLGSNGFSNLSRCVVGVPVVGKPAGSLDSSSESRSSTGSTAAQQRRSSAAARPYGSLGGQANFSLNDLVADYSENADAKIGKMVSRTARSWWQHCFEAGIIADGNMSKSVFANKEVLKECKARASNFKLLIAYTQKPQMEQRRRTMSEPTVPTLATAGVVRPQRQAS